jgi:hypothetical protein
VAKDLRRDPALVHPAKLFRNLEIQGFGNGLNALESEVSLSPLHLADVGPVHLTGRRQVFLGPFPLFPQLADTGSESGLNVPCHPRSVED